MPQMSPLMWLHLYIYFILLFMLMMSLIYFMMIYINMNSLSDEKSMNNYLNNWKMMIN